MPIFWFSSWNKIFELNRKGHKPRRAKLKILQLELWLEPARLGLITTNRDTILARRPSFSFNSIIMMMLMGLGAVNMNTVVEFPVWFELNYGKKFYYVRMIFYLKWIMRQKYLSFIDCYSIREYVIYIVSLIVRN